VPTQAASQLGHKPDIVPHLHGNGHVAWPRGEEEVEALKEGIQIGKGGLIEVAELKHAAQQFVLQYPGRGEVLIAV
jgi:hypothetical protein